MSSYVNRILSISQKSLGTFYDLKFTPGVPAQGVFRDSHHLLDSRTIKVVMTWVWRCRPLLAVRGRLRRTLTSVRGGEFPVTRRPGVERMLREAGEGRNSGREAISSRYKNCRHR